MSTDRQSNQQKGTRVHREVSLSKTCLMRILFYQAQFNKAMSFFKIKSCSFIPLIIYIILVFPTVFSFHPLWHRCRNLFQIKTHKTLILIKILILNLYTHHHIQHNIHHKITFIHKNHLSLANIIITAVEREKLCGGGVNYHH